ncbi:hypothetical protein L6452_11139 [Arctium lappa]|uniref:Uncharacterized protein n=1 Tax=Arctium lappa TaxID=4217 RepID=A0ACB9DP32_ARCLA|nr:hypothetical protein L6452_11139 [Arctium lappa]
MNPCILVSALKKGPRLEEYENEIVCCKFYEGEGKREVSRIVCHRLTALPSRNSFSLSLSRSHSLNLYFDFTLTAFSDCNWIRSTNKTP